MLTHVVVSAKKSVGANVTGIGTRIDLLSLAREWVDKREWAVACFAALSGCALACAIARTVYDRSVTRQHAADARAAEFAKLQRSYLAVYVVIMLADWMQGTHMYTLYTAYAQEEGSSVSVGTLFFSGFLAAGVLGTFTGPLVDRYGRKRACLVYVALEVTINLLEHVNDMHWLMVGRILGGISTSLLFSAFEAWMVTEHRKQGFPEEWLGVTFGHCAVWNGATAIAAGFVAQVAADRLGDIGPFQVAIALTVLAGVLILPWAENYGAASEITSPGPPASSQQASGKERRRASSPKRKPRSRSSSPSRSRQAEMPTGEIGSEIAGTTDEKKAEKKADVGLMAAWRSVRETPALLVVGAVYALFEGAMYTFVFNWVPTLADALGGFHSIAPVQGLLFSCLMAAISIGGELYNLVFRFIEVESIGVAIFACSFLCMLVPVMCGLKGWCISTSFGLQFTAFLGFEMCVGAFQPCIATLRSKYVPDSQQSTVNNLFRLPLNLLVAAGTVLSDYLPRYQIFAICATSHVLAGLCQTPLAFSVRAKASGAAASHSSGKASAKGKAKAKGKQE